MKTISVYPRSQIATPEVVKQPKKDLRMENMHLGIVKVLI